MKRRSLALLVATALAFGLVHAMAAEYAIAVPPAISSLSPAEAFRTTGGFSVRFEAADTNGIAGSLARVSVGSATYVPSVSYAGYWTGDGCDAWWVDDTTYAYFTCAIPDPGPGVHTVRVTVPDSAGEVSEKSFTIVRTAALSFANESPYPGAKVTDARVICADIVGSRLSTSTVVMKLDGSEVPCSVAKVADNRWSITSNSPVLAGSHTVQVSASDPEGSPSAIDTWTINVTSSATPPQLSAQTPADNSIVQGPFALTYHVTDAEGIDGARARAFVDGLVYPGTVTYGGYWADDGWDVWWQEDRRTADISFSIPGLSPGAHAIRVEVADTNSSWVIRTTTVLRSAPLAASSQLPAPGTYNRSAEQISVVLSGAPIDPASVLMLVDGTPYPALLSPTADGGLVSWVGAIPEGKHQVRVSATDSLGSPPMTAEWSFVVDSTPPRTASLSPSAEATATRADAGIAIRVDEPHGVDAQTARIVLDGAAVAAPQVTVDETGAWMRVPGVLGDGAHCATVTVADLAGNVLAQSWNFSMADAPRFGSLSPSGESVAERTEITAAVRDVNSKLGASAQVAVDGVPVDTALQLTGPSEGLVRTTVSGLSHGLHTATVAIADESGNESSTSWRFTVDAVAPRLDTRSPAPSAILASRRASLAAHFTDDNAIDLATARFSVDGVAVPTSASHDVSWVGQGCDAYEVEIPQTAALSASVELKDGRHTIRADVSDGLGNRAVQEWEIDVREYPTISNVRPVSGTHLTDPFADLSATVADFDGIEAASVEWRYAGNVAWTAIAASYDAASGVLTSRFDPPNFERQYEFRFSARDAGGLVKTAQTSAYFDADGPVVAASKAPAAGATIENHRVSFSARFDDTSTIDPALTTVVIDGEPSAFSAVHDTHWVGSGCDAYEEEIAGSLLVSGTKNLHDGAHTIRITATDVFGHTTSEAWSFQVKELPSVTVLSPSPNTHTRDSSISLSAKVADFDGIDEAVVSWRRVDPGAEAGRWQVVESTYETSTGMLSATFISPENEATYEFLFSARDDFGSTNAAATSVFFDASGPVCDESARRPLPGATLDDRHVVLSGSFTDTSTIDLTKTQLWIDGEMYPVASVHASRWVGSGCDAYEEDIPGTLLFSASKELHDGVHTARVRGVDVFGFDTFTDWSFEVRERPKISALKSTTGAKTFDTSATITAEVTDFDGIASAKIEWREANYGREPGEWHELQSQYDAPAGVISGKLVFPRIDTRYELRVTGVDVGGLTSSSSIRIFTTSDADRLSAGTNCGSCHDSVARHPMNNCVACHGVSSGPCSCHGAGPHSPDYLKGLQFYDHGGAYTGRTCGDCHSHDSDNETQRHASGLGGVCVDCHKQSLITEHAGRIAGDATMTCSSCHQSTNPAVTSAIAANRTDCAACHGEIKHGKGHTNSGRCTVPGCHATNGMTIHQAVGCVVCHDSPAGRSISCVTCHSTAVHASVHTSSETCPACHNVADISTVHGDNCATCHPNPRGALSSWNGTCGQTGCHPGVHSDWNYEHRLQEMGSRYGWDCESCHPVGNDPCYNCHPQTADETPPSTTSNATASYTGTATITLSATDGDGRGVRATYYQLDGSAIATGTTLVVAPPESGVATHTLEFWSTDKVFYTEEHHVVRFLVAEPERLSPRTTSDLIASYRGPAIITLFPTDAGGSGLLGTFYRLDGGPLQSGTSIFVPAPASGSQEHLLSFFSTDRAGNVEVANTASFTVSSWSDTDPPTTTSDAASNYVGAATIRLTAEDGNGSGVDRTFYRLDNGPQTEGRTVSVSPPSGGVASHTLRFWSTDKAGNIEVAKSVTFTSTANNGLVRFVWPNPPAGSWADCFVYDAAGNLVFAKRDTTGLMAVPVPLSPQPYTLKSLWYDPTRWWDPDWEGDPILSETTVIMNTPGGIFTWDY